MLLLDSPRTRFAVGVDESADGGGGGGGEATAAKPNNVRDRAQCNKNKHVQNANVRATASGRRVFDSPVRRFADATPKITINGNNCAEAKAKHTQFALAPVADDGADGGVDNAAAAETPDDGGVRERTDIHVPSVAGGKK